MNVKVLIYEHTGSQFLLRATVYSGAELIIGRDTSSDIMLAAEDAKASRRHCRVRIAEDGLMVRDERSANGTYIDGVRFGGRRTPRPEERLGTTVDGWAPWKEGTVLRAGGSGFCFKIEELHAEQPRRRGDLAAHIENVLARSDNHSELTLSDSAIMMCNCAESSSSSRWPVVSVVRPAQTPATPRRSYDAEMPVAEPIASGGTAVFGGELPAPAPERALAIVSAPRQAAQAEGEGFRPGPTTSEEESSATAEVGLLLIDMVRSTERLLATGDTCFSEIVRSLDAAITQYGPRFGCRFSKCTGDGFLLQFDNARAAITAAMGLRRLPEFQTAGPQRYVAHAGLVKIGPRNEPLGREVHRVFRIESLTEAERCAGEQGRPIPADGGLLLTRTAWESLPVRHQQHFARLGSFTLKGFDSAEEVWMEVG